MRVLGIDSATLVCSVALVSEEKTLAEYNLQVKKTHSERLLPLIAAMLRDTGLKPADLDGVAVAAGPGSFTGVRIGMVTAKTLGQALAVPLAGVSTLQALAAQHPHFPGVVCPILDARRDQVYNAVFRSGELPEHIQKERALALGELLAELQDGDEDVLFVGDAAPLHRETIADALGRRACFMPPESSVCRAAAVARLGLKELQAGGGLSWRDLEPQYVRRSEAEVKYLARKKQGGTGLDCDN
ncbi:tRNA (adenosine(37)-N6)-threonylcarbamoyltransferase complex dimerization subunit type 1 TsaB [Dethiobacter alkaliphilus]|uniref:tRNA (adenosine(37)-N6)-threonylcarbamoyltransferase complex dimerization subunit type 1 TsaB n=1 Tax=Dethiobacter alkaliphilus TaxID=427926 RepID=UPI00222719CB|nr:tRNA (adenosine(37)-N6)-threonylcarbamoyltransferase complex dimerization subunit type 1 TsaB [Dethiobacter alkaliphilus]MCW3490541.1 tRNA (adenosine(37)-N6)-threonylcarbamoyltransferase complex dimerization subunit type 1 TsaB [Dethiobacter alkaliphilus]